MSTWYAFSSCFLLAKFTTEAPCALYMTSEAPSVPLSQPPLFLGLPVVKCSLYFTFPIAMLLALSHVTLPPILAFVLRDHAIARGSKQGDRPRQQSKGAPRSAAQLGQGMGWSHEQLILGGAGTGEVWLPSLCALLGRHGGVPSRPVHRVGCSCGLCPRYQTSLLWCCPGIPLLISESSMYPYYPFHARDGVRIIVFPTALSLHNCFLPPIVCEGGNSLMVSICWALLGWAEMRWDIDIHEESRGMVYTQLQKCLKLGLS